VIGTRVAVEWLRRMSYLMNLHELRLQEERKEASQNDWIEDRVPSLYQGAGLERVIEVSID
jgi:hypothetical protein